MYFKRLEQRRLCGREQGWCRAPFLVGISFRRLVAVHGKTFIGFWKRLYNTLPIHAVRLCSELSGISKKAFAQKCCNVKTQRRSSRGCVAYQVSCVVVQQLHRIFSLLSRFQRRWSWPRGAGRGVRRRTFCSDFWCECTLFFYPGSVGQKGGGAHYDSSFTMWLMFGCSVVWRGGVRGKGLKRRSTRSAASTRAAERSCACRQHESSRHWCDRFWLYFVIWSCPVPTQKQDQGGLVESRYEGCIVGAASLSLRAGAPFYAPTSSSTLNSLIVVQSLLSTKGTETTPPPCVVFDVVVCSDSWCFCFVVRKPACGGTMLLQVCSLVGKHPWWVGYAHP